MCSGLEGLWTSIEHAVIEHRRRLRRSQSRKMQYSVRAGDSSRKSWQMCRQDRGITLRRGEKCLLQSPSSRVYVQQSQKLGQGSIDKFRSLLILNYH
jgi:hypothetical protein